MIHSDFARNWRLFCHKQEQHLCVSIYATYQALKEIGDGDRKISRSKEERQC
jgi:hypothetical protein